MKVFLLARNSQKGQAAVDEVNQRSGRSDAQLVICDLASLKSIQSAAEKLSVLCDHIDVLINNAGVITIKREETEDGFEQQLGVNHLGHFVLTGRLLPLLRRSKSGRIIIVSSGAHKIGRMDYNDSRMQHRFNFINAYARSKLANIWFMKELAKRLEGTTITANALHPGAVSTQLGVDRRNGFGALIHKLLRPFFQTPEQGSTTAVFLASSNQIEGVSGQYFYQKKSHPLKGRATNEAEAHQFWKWSEQETGFHWDI